MNINYKENSRGFTLIELLVVIAIIGLLATIAVVTMNYARINSRNSKRIADIEQISKALEIYYNRFGVYPDNSDATGYGQQDSTGLGGYYWDASCQSNGDKDTFLQPLVDAGIMIDMPNDPLDRGFQSNCYNYTSTDFPTGQALDGYYLYSFLENNQASDNNNCTDMIPNPAFNCYHQGDMQPL